MIQRSWNLAILLAATALLTGLSISSTQAGTRVVVIGGEPAPDGNGYFPAVNEYTFGTPTLNNAGQVAFAANLTGTIRGVTDNTGIFRDDPGATLTQIARAGQMAPGGSETFAPFTVSTFATPPVPLNEAGQVAFVGQLTGPPGVYQGGLYLGDSTMLTKIVRSGETAPEGDVTFSGISDPALNNSGQVAFRSYLVTSDGNRLNDTTGIFRGDGTSLNTIVRTGPSPDGNGNFSLSGIPSAPVLNDVGQSAFPGTHTSGGTSEKGIFLSDGTSLTLIASQGQTASDGIGKLDFTSYSSTPALNNAGQVAFKTSLTNAGNSTPRIFRGEGSALTQIGRANFISTLNLDLNEVGQVAYGFELTTFNNTIYRGDGTTLTPIAQEFQSTPGGDNNFLRFNSPLVINNAGQMVFSADFYGSMSGEGIFFYDDNLGLLSVAQEGDSFLGSSISRFSFSGDASSGGIPSGFNELGQVAYQFVLDDGRSGIAVWSPVPEPSSAALLAMSCLVFLRRRRKD